MKVCGMSERTSAFVATEGTAPLARPHLGCSPALGGLQLRGHFVLTELPHGKGSQRLVRPGESETSVGS